MKILRKELTHQRNNYSRYVYITEVFDSPHIKKFERSLSSEVQHLEGDQQSAHAFEVPGAVLQAGKSDHLKTTKNAYQGQSVFLLRK